MHISSYLLKSDVTVEMPLNVLNKKRVHLCYFFGAFLTMILFKRTVVLVFQMGFLQIPWKLLKMQVIQVSSLHMESLHPVWGIFLSLETLIQVKDSFLYFSGFRKARVIKMKNQYLINKKFIYYRNSDSTVVKRIIVQSTFLYLPSLSFSID